MASAGYMGDEKNFDRLYHLLIDVGTPVLIEFLMKNVRLQGFNTIDEFLKSYAHKCKNNRSLNNNQLACLYPTNGGPADKAKFDISLVIWLLNKFCKLTPAETQQINILREIRNGFSHCSTTSLEDSKYEDALRDFESVICNLLQNIGDTDLTTNTQQQIQDIKEKSIDSIGHRLEAIEHKLGRLINQSDPSQLPTTGNDGKRELQKFLVNAYKEYSQMVHLPMYEKAPETRLNAEEKRVKDGFEDQVNVDDIYVDENIKELTPYSRGHPSSDTHNTGQNLIQNGPTFAESFDQFFQPPDWDVPPRHVVLLGSAGRGKTTFCLRMISIWCSAMNKTLNESSALTGEERKVSRFEILYYIALRDVAEEESVMDMIKSKILYENKSLLPQVQECFETQPKKCLVIIDGLDEWPRRKQDAIPETINLNFCPMFWTSRPRELQLIKSTLKNVRLFELKELKDENVRILVRKVLQVSADDSSELNEKSPERINERVNKFIITLNSHGMRLATEIPLVLTYLVRLWNAKGKLEDSRTANIFGFLNFLLTKVNGIENRRTNDSIFMNSITTRILNEYDQLKLHILLIKKLSNFAYDCSKQSEIVFEIEDVIQKIGDENLAICLKTGLLSYTLAKTGETKSKFPMRIQFFHKTLQDFFAAIWITWEETNTRTLGNILALCKSTEQLEELSTILIFVSGMSSRMADRISQYICEISLEDELLCQYRKTLQGRYEFAGRRPIGGSKSYRRVKSIQQILLDCQNETKLNCNSAEKDAVLVSSYILYFKRGNVFRLHDVIFEDKIDKTVLQLIEDENVTRNLRSIYIDLPMIDITGNIENVICRAKKLERLYLDHSSSSVITRLKSDQMKTIKSLCLVSIDTFPTSMQSLCNLSALCISIRCRHDVIKELESFLKSSQKLKELELEEITCKDHKGHQSCKYQVDISKSKDLKVLRIENVFSECTILPDPLQLENVWISSVASNPTYCLCRLPKSEHLSSLVMGNSNEFCNWVKSDYEALASTLKRLHYLERVYLIGINFEQYDIEPTFYSKHKLKSVTLERVSLAEEGWKMLLLSMVEYESNECNCEAELNIISTNINKYANVLSKICDVFEQGKVGKIALDLNQTLYQRKILSLKD